MLSTFEFLGCIQAIDYLHNYKPPKLGQFLKHFVYILLYMSHYHCQKAHL